ncbi:MAG: DUF397 domain-containing protein [Streptosporangiaceae bacterium]
MTIVAVPCSHPGAVDLIDSRYPTDERLHFSAGEWREFLDAVKAGRFDHGGDSAGAPPGSGEGAEDEPGPQAQAANRAD